MRWHSAAVAAFAGLFALLSAGLILQVRDRAEIAGHLPHPPECGDCKDASTLTAQAE